MALARLQQALQDIYALNVGHAVDDYLITSPELARALDTGPGARDCPEKLLVREDADGGLSLSLYLDPGVVERLRSGGPADAENLHEHCLALEGVSHFLFLVWSAMHDRQVAPFDMELQAEVDKYVMLRGIREAGGVRVAPGELLRRLFRSVDFRDGLSPGELQRYREASRYAEQYCRRLESDYFSSGRTEEGLNELRRFYRLPRPDKLRRARAAAHPH
jgi:hypothetical protein